MSAALANQPGASKVRLEAGARVRSAGLYNPDCDPEGWRCFGSGAHGGTRTHDLLLRRQALYPAELRAPWRAYDVRDDPHGSKTRGSVGLAHKARVPLEADRCITAASPLHTGCP